MAKKVVRYKLVRHKWPDEIEAEKKVRKRRILTVATCVVFFIGGFLSNYLWNSSTSVSSNEDFDKFFDIYHSMNTGFYFGKDIEDLKDTLINGAIDGMIAAGGDKHTTYLDHNESERFTSSMEGSFVGIGVAYYEQDTGVYIISKVYKGSPAEEVGLMSGDQLYAVDGKLLSEVDIDGVKDLVAGKEGTTLELEFIRNHEHIKKTIKRGTVNDSVFSEIKGKNGIMEISSIAETTGDEVGVHLKDMKKAGCKNLIIDFRDNGGGYLVAAQEVASYLLGEDQVIFNEIDKNGNKTEYKTESGYEHYTFDKIVLIVNENTASAAEVLTAALKEQLNATVVGVNTYGKGTVQIPVTFKDGSMFKYTIAEWMSAKGAKINGVGIKPDVEVKLDPAISLGMPKLEEDESFQPDTVNVAAKSVQSYLKFLGYPVDRSDEYFSVASSEALKQYQQDHHLKVTGVIDASVTKDLLSSVSYEWSMNKDKYDLQMKKAVEIANG
ncbi:S41 family peptidase [[Eubacterium] hominis]|uniref:S41 family peptidase n=1 Tax=[Eubacterium] hominis TaxID=2764325 RepID=UPI003A4E5B76